MKCIIQHENNICIGFALYEPIIYRINKEYKYNNEFFTKSDSYINSLVKKSKNIGYISEVNVNPIYRGKGICKKMIKIFIQKILNSKIYKIYIDPHKNNLPANKCYQILAKKRRDKLTTYFKDHQSKFFYIITNHSSK